VVFTGGTFFGREAGNGFVRVNYGTRRAHVVMTLERLREALS
jgi:bifunctional pyridoxal-dependent enzyme with beta-cystathionase and maltose regulon repressor activities